MHQTDETSPRCAAQGVHALGDDGHLGDTGTKILGRQGGAPDQFQTEKKQRVVVCLENAGTFTEIENVQGAVTRQRHGERQKGAEVPGM